MVVLTNRQLKGVVCDKNAYKYFSDISPITIMQAALYTVFYTLLLAKIQKRTSHIILLDAFYFLLSYWI
ncbi:hypothetical protein I215_08251 [Galbibacter marinus]|uniref:Uncharacterized protein n=1 Tax=Galbibacter marinus TaxID=555500 RepID=K2Q323_9FLAO|nr:hypothetical protein I215_08251 [Galbibacter marinus]